MPLCGRQIDQDQVNPHLRKNGSYAVLSNIEQHISHFQTLTQKIRLGEIKGDCYTYSTINCLQYKVHSVRQDQCRQTELLN